MYSYVNVLLVVLSALVIPHSGLAQGTVFTYQGRLNDNGAPANGNYSMVFNLCETPDSGGQLASQSIVSVTIRNGLFTVALDFGANFPGADRWLEIMVKTNAGAAFSTLAPRQKLNSTPYAIRAADTTLFSGQDTNAFAPATGSANYVARSGDTMTGTLKLPANGLVAGGNQLVISNASVGIGTSSPKARLDVSGTVGVNGTTIIDAAGNWVGSPVGLQGPKGATGPPGPPGPQGPPGPATPTVAVCMSNSDFTSCNFLCPHGVAAGGCVGSSSTSLSVSCGPITSGTGSCTATASSNPFTHWACCCVCLP